MQHPVDFLESILRQAEKTRKEVIDFPSGKFDNRIELSLDKDGRVVGMVVSSIPKPDLRAERISTLRLKLKEATSSEDWVAVSAIARSLYQLQTDKSRAVDEKINRE